jgi:hypothetical protein
MSAQFTLKSVTPRLHKSSKYGEKYPTQDVFTYLFDVTVGYRVEVLVQGFVCLFCCLHIL